jgi:hypothetical protein
VRTRDARRSAHAGRALCLRSTGQRSAPRSTGRRPDHRQRFVYRRPFSKAPSKTAHRPDLSNQRGPHCPDRKRRRRRRRGVRRIGPGGRASCHFETPVRRTSSRDAPQSSSESVAATLPAAPSAIACRLFSSFAGDPPRGARCDTTAPALGALGFALSNAPAGDASGQTPQFEHEFVIERQPTSRRRLHESESVEVSSSFSRAAQHEQLPGALIRRLGVGILRT